MRARVDELVASGMSRKDAVSRASDETGLPRNAVYAAAVGGTGRARQRR